MLFVFISKDERLQRTSAEVFKAGSRAHEICATINVAFQVRPVARASLYALLLSSSAHCIVLLHGVT